MRPVYLGIIALAILVLMLGSTLLFGSDLTIYTEPGTDGAVHIRITSEGFEPKNVQVRKGTRIVWLNEDTRTHWPAANDHPTHQGYPEKEESDCAGSSFDSCRGLMPGESWGFVFNEEGSWRYHDHLFPASTGSILVGEKTSSLFSKLALLFSEEPKACPENASFVRMSGDERETLIRNLAQRSPETAWQCLKSAALHNGAVTVNVHDLAHIIGNETYRQSGLPGINICDSEFAYGCFHGVTEQLLQEEGPEVVQRTATECRALFPPGSPRAENYTGCLHGMGHGLLSWENFDLGKGLARCAVLPQLDRTYCYDGVFMEYSGSASLSSLDKDKPWALCESVDEEFHVACARYQPNIWERAFRWSTQEHAKACVTGSSAALRDNCIDSVGFIIAQRNGGDSAAIERECGVIENIEFYAKCATAGALENKFQRYNGWETLTKNICASLPSPWSAYCTERLARTPL